MTNVLRAMAGVLMVGLMSPWHVYADPVTITSGVLTWSRDGNVRVSLSGTDGLRSFALEGTGSQVPGPFFCATCDGNVLNVRLNVVGLSLLGQVTYGGQTYPVGSSSAAFGSVAINLEGSRSFDMVTATVIVPFQTTSFSRFSPPDSDAVDWLPGGGLTGSGLAYVNIDPLTLENPGLALSAEYRFGESAITPEPATALLFATGALVIAARRRRSQS